MSKLYPALVSLIVALIVSVGAHVYFSSSRLQAPVEVVSVVQEETATQGVYDRVIASGTIRCGYTSWPPFVVKNPNSGAISGLFVDYLDALGKKLNLKIEWTMEMGWGDLIEGLKTDKVDAFCVGLWPNSARSIHIDFTEPVSYQAIYPFVRIDDTRFDADISLANDPAVTVAVVDGATTAVIAAADFPKATQSALPQLSAISDILMEVASNKADIAFIDMYTGSSFIANNPDLIRPIKMARPIRWFGNVVALKADEYRFKRMLDIATTELISSGEIGRLISKYEKYPGDLFHVKAPYDPLERTE
jgi:polar amino acid transport system substrate-binding protein